MMVCTKSVSNAVMCMVTVDLTSKFKEVWLESCKAKGIKSCYGSVNVNIPCKAYENCRFSPLFVTETE